MMQFTSAILQINTLTFDINVLSMYALKLLKMCFQALIVKNAQAQAQMLSDQIMLESIFKQFKEVFKVLSSTSTQVLAPCTYVYKASKFETSIAQHTQ